MENMYVCSVMKVHKKLKCHKNMTIKINVMQAHTFYNGGIHTVVCI